MLSSPCKHQPVTASLLTQVIRAREQTVSSYESRHFQWQRCYTLKAKWFEANGPAKCVKWRYVLPYFTRWNDANHFMFHYQWYQHHNYLTTQLGTSCSFDSLGLARNEPTPGERSQGDSTHYKPLKQIINNQHRQSFFFAFIPLSHSLWFVRPHPSCARTNCFMLSSPCKRQPSIASLLTQVIRAREQTVSSYESRHFQWQRCYTLKVKRFEANGPAKCVKWPYDLPYFTRWNGANHFTFFY